jgi:hypothetical protein
MMNRYSIRLKGYDYSREGLYFITICCYKHECYFGNSGLPPNNNKIVLNDCGKIAMKCWFEIPIPIDKHDYEMRNVGAKNFSPLRDSAIPNIPKICGTSMTIGSIIRG